MTKLSDDLKNAREVLTAYDKLVDDLRAENTQLREIVGRLGSGAAEEYRAENERLREALREALKNR